MRHQEFSHDFFMDCALQEAEDALSRGEFPVGCVIVAGNEIVARGGRRDSAGQAPELEHAEIVAIGRLMREKSLDPASLTVYSTMEPCLMCFGTLVVNGCRRIVYAYEDVMGGAVNLPLENMRPLYKDMKLTVIGGVQIGRAHV
jgi:tRNA(adenine34) deaminase